MYKKYVSQALLLFVALFWGLGFVFVEHALDANIPVSVIITLRGLIPGLVLLPFVFKNKIYKKKKDLFYAILLGIVTFIGFLFQTLGQEKTSALYTSFYTSLYVIITPLFAFIITRKKLGIKNLIAAILVLLGIFTLSFLPGIINGEEIGFGLGEIYLILCAVFFALQIILITIPLKNADAFGSVSIMLLVMGICSLVMMIIKGDSFIIKETGSVSPLSGYFGIILIVVLCSLYPYIVQFFTNKVLNSAETAIILSLETPIGFLFSKIYEHSALSVYHYIGLLLGFLGIVLTNIDLTLLNAKKYKVLLLDLDNTILNFDKAEYKAFFKTMKEYQIKTGFKMFSRYKEINHELWRQYELEEISKMEVFENRFRDLFSEFHINFNNIKEISDKYLFNLSKESHFMFGAKRALKRLAKKYDLYLITNGQIDVQKGRIKAANLDQYFKKIYISEEIGYQKPKLEFFQYIKKDINYIDEEVLVIGDSLTSDIKGANNANLDSCFINRFDIESDKYNYKVGSLWKIR